FLAVNGFTAGINQAVTHFFLFSPEWKQSPAEGFNAPAVTFRVLKDHRHLMCWCYIVIGMVFKLNGCSSEITFQLLQILFKRIATAHKLALVILFSRACNIQTSKQIIK